MCQNACCLNGYMKINQLLKKLKTFCRYFRSISFLRHSIALISPDFLAIFFTFITGMVTAKILGPENLGIVGTAGMVFGYGVLLQGGILDGLGLKIPYLIGKNKKDEALIYLNVGYTGILLAVIIGIIIIVVLATIFVHDRVILIGVFANALAILAYEMYHMKEGKARLFFRFRVVFFSKTIFTFSRLILVLVFCYFWGIYGMFVAIILIYIPSYIYLRYKKEELRWNINLKKTYELLRLGFPLLLVGAIFTLFQTIDKWFIIINYGPKTLGYYSIIVALAGMILLVPIRFVSLLTQYLREQKGRGTSNRLLWKYISLSMVIGSILLLPIIAGASDAAYGLFRFFLTKYDKTIPLIRIILSSCFILSLFYVCSVFLVVTDKKRYMLTAQVISILFAIIFNWLAVAMGTGLQGIAFAMLASNIVLVVLTLYFIKRGEVAVADMKGAPIFFVMVVYVLFCMAQNLFLPLAHAMENSCYLKNLIIRFCMDLCFLLVGIIVIKLTNMYKPLLEFMKR